MNDHEPIEGADFVTPKHPTFSLLNAILVVSLFASLSAWFRARLEVEEMKEELIKIRVEQLQRLARPNGYSFLAITPNRAAIKELDSDEQ